MPFPTTQVDLDSGDTSVTLQATFKFLPENVSHSVSNGNVDPEESGYRVDASFMFFLFWYYGTSQSARGRQKR